MERKECEDEIIRREPMFVWDETVFSIEELFDVDGHTVNPNLDLKTITAPDVILAFDEMDHSRRPILISGRVALLRRPRVRVLKVAMDYNAEDVWRLIDLCGETLGWNDSPLNYFTRPSAGASDNPPEVD